MSVSVFSAAKYLAEKSGWSLTNLQIQKILYLAQKVYMGRNDGKRLIESYFEAWDYGPVCPPLYRKLKIYGADPVGNIFRAYEMPEQGSAEEEMLRQALDNLSGIAPSTLVKMTHKRNGAWDKHYHDGIRGIAIPNNDIWQEYKDDFGQA